MLNYIKSEFYRVFHTKGVYIGTGCLLAAIFIGNLGIRYFGRRYAITSYSYSNLVVNPMIFAAMGTLVAYLLYEGSRKNGNLKNTVSGGISRTKIFVGECVVSLVAATILMALTLLTWIISAQAFLEKTGPVELKDLLLEVPAVYLIAAASLISGIVFLDLFEKNIVGILLWAFLWFVLPRLLLYVGMRFETVYDIALWFPYNFFALTNGQNVNMGQCLTFWELNGGMFRCVCSGAAGVVIFSLSGVFALRRKEF